MARNPTTQQAVALLARRSGGLLLFSLLALGGAVFVRAAAQSAATFRAPPRVLVLYAEDRLLPANLLFDESFRSTLRAHPDTPIDYSSEFLDEERFPARYEERLRDVLVDKYGERPPDVIVACARPSLDFCLRNQARLFAEAPIVFAGTGPDIERGSEVSSRLTGLRASFDGLATLRLALRLHPRTQQVFVIEDAIAADSVARAPGWSSFQQPGVHATFHRLASQPLAELLDRLSHLPDQSLVIDLSVPRSGARNNVAPQDIAARMASASRAPIYAAFDPFIGSGYVGAVTTPMDEIGRETAELVLRVLSRPPGAALPAIRTLAARPILDWRQMRRWGIRRKQLPPGALLRFEPPSFWRQHFVLVVTAAGLFLLQSGLILALVLQSVRRRRAEREERRRRQEMEHMMRVATMGELTASLAHEINQPLTAILANAQTGQRLLASGQTNLREIREIFDDIAADDQRAGEVIRRIRTLLRKGQSEPATVDANALVTEVAGLIRVEMIRHNISLGLELSPEPPLVQGDRIQLQQVLLNLMMNSIDAMKETSGVARRLVVRTSNGRSVRVSVSDSGRGIPEEKVEQVFEPFVTTKPQGMGMGLAICRSIVQAHGGRIGAQNAAHGGATFWFTLPSEGGKS